MSEPGVVVGAHLDRDAGVFYVEWSDGHRSNYRLVYLRSRCPCASCRTERTAARQNPFHVLAGAAPTESATALEGVEPVGRYGVRFEWGDGHSAGIYTFAYLRSICPCGECRGGPEEAPFVHGIRIPG